MKALLNNALSPKSASEFLTLSFNPAKLISVLQSDPPAVLCDFAKFEESFKFPKGVDVATIQKQLCEASSNGSLVMHQVWQLFDMQQLVEELGRLVGEKPAQLAESPFRSFMKQAQRFLQNTRVITRLIQMFDKQMPNVSMYVNALLTTVNTYLSPDSNNIGGMCDAAVELIEQVPQYSQARPYLAQMQKIYAIVAKMATSLDQFDEFLCDLSTMDMSMLIGKVMKSGALDLINEIVSVSNTSALSDAPFKCSQMIRDVMVPQQKIQNMINDAINGSYAVCIKKLQTQNITMLQELISYQSLLGGLRDILNSESLAQLEWLKPLRPLLNELIAGLVDQVGLSFAVVQTDSARLICYIRTSCLFRSQLEPCVKLKYFDFSVISLA